MQGERVYIRNDILDRSFADARGDHSTVVAMFPATLNPHFGYYDPHHHQHQPSFSPSHFIAPSSVDPRRGTESSGPLPYAPATNGVIPSLGTPSHPGRGYIDLPLPPSPGAAPFTTSASADSQGESQGNGAVMEAYINRFG